MTTSSHVTQVAIDWSICTSSAHLHTNCQLLLCISTAQTC